LRIFEQTATFRQKRGAIIVAKSRGFTLIELLVVIAIMVLLMAILMPTLRRARKQAKDTICRSNLHYWGLVFSVYTDDNDGYFQDRVWFDDGPEPWDNPLCFGGHSWPTTLLPYYKDTKLRFCPMATKSYSQGVPASFAAWVQLDNVLNPDDAEYIPAGSYGLNDWVVRTDLGHSGQEYWKTPNVKGASDIPVLLDAWWPAGFPMHTDEPPAYDGEVRWGSEMVRFCVNRHDLTVNCVFADWSVRKVGLKELWKLKWHRMFDTNGPWTMAGWCRVSDWPEWMRRCKDY